MTLAAAFRGPKGGILLCSDQEWNDANVSKRGINKNYCIGLLKSCEFFISGSGPDTPILRAWEEIHKSLAAADANGKDVFLEHRDIIETTLKNVHKQFARDLKIWPMNLLVVVAPRAMERAPMLYRTDGPTLIPEPYYYAVGSGKPISDYLADRLYDFGRLNKRELVALAAFILREAADSSIGVGMGANMVFIHEGEKAMHFMPPGTVEEMQDGIPSLKESIEGHWPGKLTFPEWMGS